MGLPDKGFLTSAAITLTSAIGGPVRVGATFQPENIFNKSAPLTSPKWIRSDGNFGIHDGWRWDGSIPLTHKGEKDKLVFIARNDSQGEEVLVFTWNTKP